MSKKETEEEVEEQEEDFSYFLQSPTNTLIELELVVNKNNRIVFKEKKPVDLVKILIKGEIVEVDLIYLRELAPEAVEHGQPVAKLIVLAEAAKG